MIFVQPLSKWLFFLLLIASLAFCELTVWLSCPSVIFLAKLNMHRWWRAACAQRGSPHLRDQFSSVHLGQVLASCFLLWDGDALVRLAMGSVKITSTLCHSATLLFTLWINSKTKFEYQLTLLKCLPVFCNPTMYFPEFLPELLCYLEEIHAKKLCWIYYTCSNPAVFLSQHTPEVSQKWFSFEDSSFGWDLQHFCWFASTK